MPDLRRLILVSVLSMLGSLAVTSFASVATEAFTNPTLIGGNEEDDPDTDKRDGW